MSLLFLLGVMLSAAPAPAASCAGETNGAASWVTKLADIAAGSSVGIEPNVHLVRRSAPPLQVPSAFAVVSIAPASARVDGQSLAATTASAFHTALTERRRAHEAVEAELGGKSPTPDVIVAVDADAKWGRVVAVTEAAITAGYSHAVFLFDDPSVGLPPPDVSKIDSSLQQISRQSDPQAKEQLLSQLTARVTAPCPGLARAAADKEGKDPALLLRGMAEALPQCGCGLDLDSLRSLLWNTFYAEPRFGVVVPLAGKGRRVVASSLDSWERTHRGLLEALAKGGPLRLSGDTEPAKATK
jgi:hypothetical protein